MVKTNKLNSERYGGFDIHFEYIWNGRGDRAVEVSIYEDRKLIQGTNRPTKQEAFDWARDYIDETYGNQDLNDWKAIAKKELEKKLGVKTRVVSYPYYDDYDGLALESISGTANNGEREWIVFENEDVAEKTAVAKVKEDLENEPYLFSPSFLEDHIDMDNLNDTLRSDIDESSRNYYDDISNEDDDTYGNRQIRELVEGGYLDERETWNNKDNTAEKYEEANDYDDALEKAISSMTDDSLSEGGVEYLKGIYGNEDAMKKAIEMGGIDYDEASQDAVDTDGVAHFLDGYDGNEENLPSGAVAYGTN